MTTIKRSLAVCAILALAAMFAVATTGTGLPVLSHGIDPLPCDDCVVAHGIDPLPCDDCFVAHGIDPLPCDDCLVLAHGIDPLPCDDCVA